MVFIVCAMYNAGATCYSDEAAWDCWAAGEFAGIEESSKLHLGNILYFPIF